MVLNGMSYQLEKYGEYYYLEQVESNEDNLNQAKTDDIEYLLSEQKKLSEVSHGMRFIN